VPQRAPQQFCGWEVLQILSGGAGASYSEIQEKHAEMVLSRYDDAGCRPGRLWHGVCSMVEHMDGYPLRNANRVRYRRRP
jgi:hypothetical protein